MIIVTPRGRVTSDGADTKCKHFRIAGVGPELGYWQHQLVGNGFGPVRNSGFSRPLPQIRQGVAQLAPCWSPFHQSSQPTVGRATGRSVPKYKADDVTSLLCERENLDFDQHSGPSLRAPASPWTHTEPRPFLRWIYSGLRQGLFSTFLPLHILFLL